MTDLVSPAHGAPAAGPGSGAPTVMLVDADDRTRESLVGLLGVHGRSRVVGSAGTIAEALALLKRERPEVLVVDPRLPELEAGLVFMRRARAIHPGVKILGVSWTTAHEGLITAAGADAFIRKTFRPHELADAVARCAEVARAAGSRAADTPTDGAGVATDGVSPGVTRTRSRDAAPVVAGDASEGSAR